MSRATKLMINGVVADLGAETLRGAGGRAIALRPQTFATFRHLVANANRLVSKDELMRAVWPDTAVTDDSLVQCIHEIRRALNDEARDVLQTVSRRGYRLVLPEENGDAPARPSIAVLPFTSLNGAEGDYFADGLVDDVITNLSKIPDLFVIARNSSFSYRGTPTDVRTIADELGVRYLLEGSVARSGARLRINARLIDGASAKQVWGGRFDGAAEDVFDLQDQLTEQIVGVIEPSIRRAEIERARRSAPTASMPTTSTCGRSRTRSRTPRPMRTRRCGCSRSRCGSIWVICPRMAMPPGATSSATFGTASIRRTGRPRCGMPTSRSGSMPTTRGP